MRLTARKVFALSLVFVLVLAACQPGTPAPTVTVRPTATDVPPTDAAAEMATEEATEAAMDMATEEATEVMMEPTEEATVEVAMADMATEEATEVMMEPTEEATVEVAMADMATEEATEVMMEPTEEMTEEPTVAPTEVPTEEPTAAPTEVATEEPTEEATVEMAMDATAEMTMEPAMDATAEATEMAAPSTEDMTIAEVVAGDENFSILLAAVSTAGLADALAGEGPLTVFAPTNAAFEALLETLEVSADDLLAREDLASILLYHVVAGTVPAETLVTLIRTQSDNELSIRTLLEGAELNFTLGEDNAVIINETVMVTVANIRTANGIIHVIDAVLLPPAGE